MDKRQRGKIHAEGLGPTSIPSSKTRAERIQWTMSLPPPPPPNNMCLLLPIRPTIGLELVTAPRLHMYITQLGTTLHCKKENWIFLTYKEVQSGAVAKFIYMRKGFLIYEKMRKYFPIYTVKKVNNFPVPSRENGKLFLQCMRRPLDFATAPSEFTYIGGKFDFLFYQCAL